MRTFSRHFEYDTDRRSIRKRWSRENVNQNFFVQQLRRLHSCTHTSFNSTQLTPTPSSRPHLANLPMGDGARPPGNFNLTASFNLHALGASASPLDPFQGGVWFTTSQNLDDFALWPIDASVSRTNNPHSHPPARSPGADDDASTGTGGMRWEAIFILLPPTSRPPLHLIHNHAAAQIDKFIMESCNPINPTSAMQQYK